MKRKPKPEPDDDDFDAWLAELCRAYRSYKRMRRRALMERNRLRLKAEPESPAVNGERVRLIEGWVWPRPNDPELELNLASIANRKIKVR